MIGYGNEICTFGGETSELLEELFSSKNQSRTDRGNIRVWWSHFRTTLVCLESCRKIFEGSSSVVEKSGIDCRIVSNIAKSLVHLRRHVFHCIHKVRI